MAENNENIEYAENAEDQTTEARPEEISHKYRVTKTVIVLDRGLKRDEDDKQFVIIEEVTEDQVNNAKETAQIALSTAAVEEGAERIPGSLCVNTTVEVKDEIDDDAVVVYRKDELIRFSQETMTDREKFLLDNGILEDMGE